MTNNKLRHIAIKTLLLLVALAAGSEMCKAEIYRWVVVNNMREKVVWYYAEGTKASDIPKQVKSPFAEEYCVYSRLEEAENDNETAKMDEDHELNPSELINKTLYIRYKPKQEFFQYTNGQLHHLWVNSNKTTSEDRFYLDATGDNVGREGYDNEAVNFSQFWYLEGNDPYGFDLRNISEPSLYFARTTESNLTIKKQATRERYFACVYNGNGTDWSFIVLPTSTDYSTSETNSGSTFDVLNGATDDAYSTKLKFRNKTLDNLGSEERVYMGMNTTSGTGVLYFVVNNSGELAIYDHATQAAGAAPSLPASITSPFVSSYTYYSDRACTEPMATLPTNHATVYVRYSVKDQADWPLDLTGGTFYNFISESRNRYLYNTASESEKKNNVNGLARADVNDETKVDNNYLWKLQAASSGAPGSLIYDPYDILVFSANGSPNNYRWIVDEDATGTAIANTYRLLKTTNSSADLPSRANRTKYFIAKNSATPDYYEFLPTWRSYKQDLLMYVQPQTDGGVYVQAKTGEQMEHSYNQIHIVDPIHIDVTYHVMSASGTEPVSYTEVVNYKVEHVDYRSRPIVPDAISSPLVATYTYYKDAACTLPYGGSESLASNATAPVDVYVRYTANDELNLNGEPGEYFYYVKVNGKCVEAVSEAELGIADSYTLTHAYQWYLDAGNDPYQVKVKNLGNGQFFASVSDGSAVSLDATGETFYIRAGQTVNRDGIDVHLYELVAVTSNPVDMGGTHYTVGCDGSAVKLYASGTKGHLADELQVELIVQKISVPYTVIDKQGKIVLEVESKTQRLELPAEWQSPMVKTYHYWRETDFEKAGDIYTLKTSPAPTELDNTVGVEKVFVTYDPYVSGEANYIDLNSGGFTSLNDGENSLMQKRVIRTGTDNMSVRDASKFGTMYMLKFRSTDNYYLEDGGDDVEETVTPTGTYVYPYTNGDGPMYVYTQARWDNQMNNGASTRTRWPWYLVSFNNDPYRVYVTAWQNTHSVKNAGITTNHYSYLRTYKNTTLGEVITASVTDDPTTLYPKANSEDPDVQILPSEYMLLGTTGAYKLKTTEKIEGEHQAVKSFEQYWRNNPTALYKEAEARLGRQLTTEEKSAYKSGHGPLTTEEQKNRLRTNGWHEYSAYVNASPWHATASSTKEYKDSLHWFMTVNVEETFDLVPTEIDAVMVLLDNHGWELMRHPIAKSTETAKYATVQADLRKWDSPMVKQYKFYAYRSADHKVPGYHKYEVAEKDLAGKATSLASYPEKYSGGALYDLYVTYDVKDEYAALYNGAATEAGTSASMVQLRMGTKYAMNQSGSLTGLPAANIDNTNDKLWILKPHFDIDTEMGYLYDVKKVVVDATDAQGNVTASHEEVVSKEETNANYHAAGQSGFDPYNIRISSVVDATKYFVTDATQHTLGGGVWTSNGSSVSLSEITKFYPEEGYDSRKCNVTNATFMALQDGNGNMRLAPRFGYGKVLDNFTTLAVPAADQPKGDESHTQTVRIVTPVTYHLIDNSDNEVFGAIYASNGIGLMLPKQYQSPLVDTYYYHSTLDHAKGASTRLTSDVLTATPGATVYVTYRPKSSIVDNAPFAVCANGRFMHMTYDVANAASEPYKVTQQQYEYINKAGTGTNDITTANYPLLDNNFVWDLGLDPYRVTFRNKATGRYCNPVATDAPATLDAASTGTYAVLYWTDADGVVDPLSDVARVLYRGSSNYVVSTSNNDYDWRVAAVSSEEPYKTGSKFSFLAVPSVMVNVLDSHDRIEAELQAYYNVDGKMPVSVPYSMQRAFTSGHQLYYDNKHAVAVTMDGSKVLDATKLSADNNLFMTYTLDADKWSLTKTNEAAAAAPTMVRAFDATKDNDANFYGLRYAAVDANCVQSGSGDLPQSLSQAAKTALTGDNLDTDAGKLGQWMFIGTPYHLEIANRAKGINSRLAIPEGATTSNKAEVYYADASGVSMTWEAVADLNNTTDKLFIRQQGSFNGQGNMLYLSGIGTLTEKAGTNAAYDVFWTKYAEVREKPHATLTLTGSSTWKVDDEGTMTATATPETGKNVTYFAVEQKIGEDTWKVIGTPYEGVDVTGEAEKDGAGVVTLTVKFTPEAAETYEFRARAIVDNDEELPALSTDSRVGPGTTYSFTAGTNVVTARSDNYTLILVDKSGNELFTETNVSKTRVETANSISHRTGDPIDDSWRSPLVDRYFYYSTKADAQGNTGNNLFDWASTAETPTVYVGYRVSDRFDTDGRTHDETDGSGKKYLLKYIEGTAFNQEDGKDGRLATATKPVYPYNNGDAALYIYGEEQFTAQQSNASSTRTRWAWYLEGGDPYRLKIGSFQTQTSKYDGSKNYHSYLRTYQPDGYNSIVTSVITDNDTVVGQPPTEYMVLRTADGHCKLMTTETVPLDLDNNGNYTGDGESNERRTVNSFEQYWKNNPTVNKILGDDHAVVTPETLYEGVGIELNATQKALLPAGWHTYKVWANAAPWMQWTDNTSGKNTDKKYSYRYHWFQTVSMGEKFDLVEIELDGVLVLLDQHGWEVMRKPTAKPGHAKKTERDNAIKVFDSPMVKKYHFWTNFSKANGYHKYKPTRGQTSASKNAIHQGEGASLADYPTSKSVESNGTLTDIYVTYEVADEYTSTYQGAATEAETATSKFVLRQNSKYAQATSSTTVAAADLPASITDDFLWKLKPNFNIDAEMGYRYDGAGALYGELSKAETEQDYLDDRDPVVYDTQYGRNGFDPYNIQIESVSQTGQYLTTNATDSHLDGTGGMVSVYSSGDMRMQLNNHNSKFNASDYWDIGTGYQIPHITNSTFMAIQDTHGNMRLMPRFDHRSVMKGITLLSAPARLNVYDATHEQTTRLGTPTTFHIVDNSGAEVISQTVVDEVGLVTPREIQSPWVNTYYYHDTQDHAAATATRTTTNLTTVPADVYVGYTVKSNFAASRMMAVWGANNKYMHAVYDLTATASADYWRMDNAGKDAADAGNNITTENMPFLDNTFVWQFGEKPDPYNLKFLNRGAQRYIVQANDAKMETLSPSVGAATSFAVLYYGDDAEGYVMYNRSLSKYVEASDADNGSWTLNASRTANSKLTFADLPLMDINVLNGSGEVECTLEGHYKSGCTWAKFSKFTPFYLERYATSNQTFYYDAAHTSEITGTVDDATVNTEGAVYVTYTLDAAKWGVPSGADETAIAANETDKKNANSILVMPSPSSNKINWYAVRSSGQGEYIAATAPTDGTAPTLTAKATVSTDISDHVAHWAFMGTPYHLDLVERSNGTAAYLGVNPADAATTHTASIQVPSNHNDWEVCTGVGGIDKLLIRPLGSLNGEAPYLYLGCYDASDSKMGVAADLSSNVGIDLTWLAETEAKTLVFKLFDKQGVAVEGVADFTMPGASPGDNLATVFSHTGMERRYCDYTFYNSDTFGTEVTTATEGTETMNVYVKWDYTDDAPVFSTGTEARDYQYYMIEVNTGIDGYLMDVEEVKPAEGDPYNIFIVNNDVHSVKEYKHQFALVGNPYRFKLYSRKGEKFICNHRLTGDGVGLGFDQTIVAGKVTNEVEFDLPADISYVSNNEHTLMKFRERGKKNYITSNADHFYMHSGTGSFCRLRDIIIPVHVFKYGATALANQVDYREYALTLNPSGTPGTPGTPRAVDARITDDDLRETANAIGTAHDFRHAFCNYVFYYGYDWVNTLHSPIPSVGLPYYGGKDQYKRQFFATYTVDEANFGKVYLISNTTHADHYFGKGTKTSTTSVSATETVLKNYYELRAVNSLEEARADATKAFRWQMVGDPYNLRLTNLGTGDDYETMSLGATKTSALDTDPTKANGQLMLLTNDTEYATQRHWEIIARHDGNYVFFMLDSDVTSPLDPHRYTHSLEQYYSNEKVVSAEGVNEVILTPAEPQHEILWQVVGPDGHLETYARKKDTHVTQGSVLTMDDMAEELQRRFCDYTLYPVSYTDAGYNGTGDVPLFNTIGSPTEISANGLTVDRNYIIYAKYALQPGAPTFYASESAYTGTAEEDKDPAYIRLHPKKYLNGNSVTDDVASATKWVLIGDPYDVQFWDPAANKYLYVDLNNIVDGGATIPLRQWDGTEDELKVRSWTLYNCRTGQMAAVALKEDNEHLIYMVHDETNAVYRLYGDISEAIGADFIDTRGKGVDYLDLSLTYSSKTERKNATGVSMAGQTEVWNVNGYYGLGTRLTEMIPPRQRRAFCNYQFKYKGNDVTEITQEMCTDAATAAPGLITIDVTYTYDTTSPFKWSSLDDKDFHWYYLVNHHKQGFNDGYMLCNDNTTKVRADANYREDAFYTSNYEWCVVGDPYGFRILGHYDPDMKFNRFLSVDKDPVVDAEGNFVTVAYNDQSVYEMRPGDWTDAGYFWIHPAYTETQRTEVDASVSSLGINGSQPVLMTGNTRLQLCGNTSRNFRLTETNDNVMVEYVKYQGYVGGISNEIVSTLSTDKQATYNSIKEKVDAGTPLTTEELAFTRQLVEDGGTLSMKEGYYRIVPYVFEKGEQGETAGNAYLRGYLYGQGTDGYKPNGSVSGGNAFLDRQETDGTDALKTIMLNLSERKAEYDPSSIFYFKTVNGAGEPPRYQVIAQGLYLTSDGSMETYTDAHKNNYECRYENIGGMFSQLRLGQTENTTNYLSWVPYYADSYPEEARRVMTRKSFEAYHGTRMFLQPVDMSDNNTMKLKVEVYPGKYTDEETHEQADFYFSSLYVPYDVVLLTADAYAYVGAELNTFGERRLLCKKVPAQSAGGKDYEAGKFIPGGTPVLLRIKKSGDFETNNVDNYAMDGYDRLGDDQTFFVKVGLPTTKPTSNAYITEKYPTQFFKGSYLEQKLPEGVTYYVFGQGTTDDYTTKSTAEVGFYRNKNTVDGSTTYGMSSNRYVRHNKVYIEGSSISSSRPFVGLCFETTGIETTGAAVTSSRAIYDLQGRQVATEQEVIDGSWKSKLSPGVYVRNGRKFVKH